MKADNSLDRFIVLLRDMVSDLDTMMNSDAPQKEVLKWRDSAVNKLARLLGADHDYVASFDAIDFVTPAVSGLSDDLPLYAHRLGLDDARSYLVALLDEVESENNQAPGMMDIESLFSELGRYTNQRVGDPQLREQIYRRLNRLRDGMMEGDISGLEVQNHVRQLGYLNGELFERLVPLLAWYYLQEGAEPGVYNN